MPLLDRLSSLILKHWSRYQPSMLEQLLQQDRLSEELEKTANRFAEMLHELVSVRKMEYHQAWELAISEILMPEESSSMTPNAPPATSG